MQASIGTARTTGLLYLGLALTGMLGFLVVRSQLFDPDDAAATAANLAAHESLARAGIALELGVVLTQALVALWFYRLFRSVDAFAAASIAVFGTVNAAVILTSSAFLATALEPGADPQVMYLVSGHLWTVGGLFFGLWLIPMGWCAWRGGLPRALGWLLMAGGAGYVLGAFARYLLPDAAWVADALVLPATAGELWMIGYLLTWGLRRSPGSPHPDTAGRPTPAEVAAARPA